MRNYLLLALLLLGCESEAEIDHRVVRVDTIESVGIEIRTGEIHLTTPSQEIVFTQETAAKAQQELAAILLLIGQTAGE